MFTGLVTQQGEVIANEIGKVANRLVLRSCFKELETGESIAVNGVCLTLLPESCGLLQFDISPETLSLTTLNGLKKGDKVNLERAMLATSRFGGHYVSGHIDTTAAVLGIIPIENFLEITLSDFDKAANLYLLPKGSITVEGVSLTINTVTKEGIKIMLVPHTLANTTLGQMEIGQRVNVEFDYLTRIVAHQLSASGQLKVEV